jgi:hypothetical protein
MNPHGRENPPLVCPLTPSRPGWMQMVCIEKASSVVIKNR